jgi:ubiquinone/menaquinone biosynthesis C-methylase UbiE
MTKYLNFTFNNDETFISTFDEAPLWSAAFGLLLFKHLNLKPGITAVDIGSGAGFPLMELAGRLGPSSSVYGIDPWTVANERAKQKIRNYNLSNITIIESSAELIPLPDDHADLVVSNLGINNFENPDNVFKECYRILKPGGTLALTSNITGHWSLFYTIFYQTLEQLNKQSLIPNLQHDELHRGTTESIQQLFSSNRMRIVKTKQETMEMKFADGTAFLNHHFVKPGWLTTWMGLFPKEELEIIFEKLEQNLNTYAAKSNGLALQVPMVYIEGIK